MNVDKSIIEAITAHAKTEYARRRECCGLVIVSHGKQVYLPCRNRAGSGAEFEIAAEDYAAAEDRGEVVLVVHSHVGVPAIPSAADMVGMEKSGLPWLIMNMPTGAYQIHEPTGFVAPLVGRSFVHGVFDCYSLIVDYYRETLGVALKDYAREDKWWLKGENLYRHLFADAGFYEVGLVDLQPHDIIFMRLGASVDNHGAIFLGDDQILHHPMGRLSSRDVYGGFWRKISTTAVRYRGQA